MSQPEARLQRRIQAALRDQRSAYVFKVHGGPMMRAGLPDLIICTRGGFFLGLEVKMPGNEPSQRQLYEHALIRTAGGSVETVQSVADALAAYDRCVSKGATRSTSLRRSEADSPARSTGSPEMPPGKFERAARAAACSACGGAGDGDCTHPSSARKPPPESDEG